MLACRSGRSTKRPLASRTASHSAVSPVAVRASMAPFRRLASPVKLLTTRGWALNATTAI
jgi:hypothetical protein